MFYVFFRRQDFYDVNVTDFQVQLSVWRGGSEGEGQEF